MRYLTLFIGLISIILLNGCNKNTENQNIPECRIGDTKSCVNADDDSKIYCGKGEITCNNDGTWGNECVGRVEASVEKCDGIDNDCDESTDEEDDMEFSDSFKNNGVCENLKKICSLGEEKEPDYTKIEGYEEKETLCDGLDNDCDGETDEELTPDLSENSQGVCLNIGYKKCNGISGWGEPDYTIIPDYEVSESSCDGLDNDCDGKIDFISGVECECETGDVKKCGDTDTGECKFGEQSCNEEGKWNDCTAVVAIEEICDGLDNDCDSEVDEGIVPPAADKNVGVCSGQLKICSGINTWQEPNYNGIIFYETDESLCDGLDNDCDGVTDEITSQIPANKIFGLCAGSKKTCANGKWNEPDYTLIADYNSNEDTCADKKDNDCDGSIDENCSCVANETINCGIDEGRCSVGVQNCTNDKMGICPGYTEDFIEICDSYDNDCDGETDEELVFKIADKTDGVCINQVKKCVNGVESEPDYSAITGYESVETLCDGLDNDCDGETDEIKYIMDSGVESDGISPPESLLTQGVCAGLKKVCDGTNGWIEPVYSELSEYQDEEILCDELDNDCDGNTDENGCIVWKYDTGSKIYTSPAVSDDGTIYIGSGDNYLYALNPNKDDKFEWSFEAGGAILSSPIIGHDGTVYFGSYDNKIYAINSITYLEKWAFETGSMVLGSPAIDLDNNIYIGSTDHYFYAITVSGELKWKFDVGSCVYGSPAVSKDGVVYFGAQDGKLFAVNKETGKSLWESETDSNNDNNTDSTENNNTGSNNTDSNVEENVENASNDENNEPKWSEAFQTGDAIYSSPVLDENGTIYLGSNDMKLYAVNPEDGTKKWEFLSGGEIKGSAVLGSNNLLYFGSQDKKIYAINTLDGTKKWELELDDEIESTPLLGSDNMVFIGTNGNKLYAVQDKDTSGEIKWIFESLSDIKSSASVGPKGILYVGSFDKKLYAISAENLELLDSFWPKFGKDIKNTKSVILNDNNQEDTGDISEPAEEPL